MVTNIGLPGFLMIIVMALVWTVPYWMLLPKFGFSKYLSLLCLIPFLGSFIALIFLWVLAFSHTRNEGDA